MMSSYTLQPIANIAELCHQHGIRHAVISPGSRSAPLTISFARHPHITTQVIADERSAAFIALGMAQQCHEPVVLICTSGSAAYNYAPAVAEAFFQQIPLLILTADRPPEWIGQHDGQTIFQQNIYGHHVAASYQLPSEYTHKDVEWHLYRIVNEAIHITKKQKLPVHINVPLREPFYPTSELHFEKNLPFFSYLEAEKTLSEKTWEELLSIWNTATKRLIVAGQQDYNGQLNRFLDKINAPVVADIFANIRSEKTISHHDAFLQHQKEGLSPEILITFGKSVIAKNLKAFLRSHRPLHHWHIQMEGIAADTFQSLTKVIPVEPTYFFAQLFKRQACSIDKIFGSQWTALHQKTKAFFKDFFNQNTEKLTEFEVVHTLLKVLPSKSVLHLANSMSVRYANVIGIEPEKEIEVYANRGTSGIDGSTSTAVGHACIDKERVHTLLTGDVAFFYDRNALWNTILPPNLRIVLLNNHGGGIFKLIESGKQPECDAFFVTEQPLSAKRTAQDAQISYFHCQDREKLAEILSNFFMENNTPALLEIETSIEDNTAFFMRYREALKMFLS